MNNIEINEKVESDVILLVNAGKEKSLAKVTLTSNNMTFVNDAEQISLLYDWKLLNTNNAKNNQIKGDPWISGKRIIQANVSFISLCTIKSIQSLRINVRFIGILNTLMRTEYLQWNYLLLKRKVMMEELIEKSIYDKKWISEGMHLYIDILGNKCVFKITNIYINNIIGLSNIALQLNKDLPNQIRLKDPNLFTFKQKEYQLLSLLYGNLFVNFTPFTIYQAFNQSIFSTQHSNSVLEIITSSSVNVISMRKLLYSKGLLSPLLAVLSNDTRYSLLSLAATIPDTALYIDCTQFVYYYEKEQKYKESELQVAKTKDFTLLLDEVRSYASERAKIIVIDNLPESFALTLLLIWLKDLTETILKNREVYIILIIPLEDKDKVRKIQSIIGLQCMEIELDSTDSNVKNEYMKQVFEFLDFKDIKDQIEVKQRMMREVREEYGGVEVIDLIKLLSKER